MTYDMTNSNSFSHVSQWIEDVKRYAGKSLDSSVRKGMRERVKDRETRRREGEREREGREERERGRGSERERERERERMECTASYLHGTLYINSKSQMQHSIRI